MVLLWVGHGSLLIIVVSFQGSRFSAQYRHYSMPKSQYRDDSAFVADHLDRIRSASPIGVWQ